jgi:hypothetical protein
MIVMPPMPPEQTAIPGATAVIERLKVAAKLDT